MRGKERGEGRGERGEGIGDRGEGGRGGREGHISLVANQFGSVHRERITKWRGEKKRRYTYRLGLGHHTSGDPGDEKKKGEEGDEGEDIQCN